MGFPGSVFTDDAVQVENTKIQTTGASATTLWSRTLPTSSVLHVRAEIVGIKSDGSDRARYVREFTYYRASGNATLADTDYAPIPDYESDATWGGPALAVATGTVSLQVTGKAATTINWRARVQILPG